MPTKATIESGMRWLVHDAKAGDVLFFHFSGHGSHERDREGIEESGQNQTILPVDFHRAGQITDDRMAEIMVNNLPAGVRLTALFDSCHSGTPLDLPYIWTGDRWKEETNPYFSRGDVQTFGGCTDSGLSADSTDSSGKAGGAMTVAFCDALRRNPCPTYPELMRCIGATLRRRGHRQCPQLSSSQRFQFDRPFLMDDIIPNGNKSKGQVIRKRFQPQHQREGKRRREAFLEFVFGF